MSEFFLFICIALNMLIVFLIFRAISYFDNRIRAIEKEYLSSVNQTFDALEQIRLSMEGQSLVINREFVHASLQNQKSFTELVKYTKEIVERLTQTEAFLVKRKGELEAEIIRLKSILSRKERRND